MVERYDVLEINTSYRSKPSLRGKIIDELVPVYPIDESSPLRWATMLGSRIRSLSTKYERHESVVEFLQLCITMVSRQVREESLPVFYGGNTFVATTNSGKPSWTLPAWLTAIGHERAKRIKKVVLLGESVHVLDLEHWLNEQQLRLEVVREPLAVKGEVARELEEGDVGSSSEEEEDDDESSSSEEGTSDEDSDAEAELAEETAQSNLESELLMI